MSLEGILASLNLRKITDKTQLDLWHWHEFDGKMVNKWKKSTPNRMAAEVEIVERADGSMVHFCPEPKQCSLGSVSMRANYPLRKTSQVYWEVLVEWAFGGTSAMFGVGTTEALVSVSNEFMDVLGGYSNGKHSYGLSHKGMVVHECQSLQFCEPFPNDGRPYVVGVLFDGPNSRIGFAGEGTWLGWAFAQQQQLNFGDDDGSTVYYPMIASTMQDSQFTLLKDSIRGNCEENALRAADDNYIIH